MSIPGLDDPFQAAALRDEVAAASWYHTMSLAAGIRTPGVYDLTEVLQRSPLPASLHGKRCLDVGTADGYWAFELERRGASEVIATDVDDTSLHDWPAAVSNPAIRARRSGLHARAFTIAREALGSGVTRIDVSPYELSPQSVGHFDFVFVGSLLAHLRDPHRALAAVRSVTRGQLLCNDVVSLRMTLAHPITPTAVLRAVDEVEWWVPNIAGLRRYLAAAGFDILEVGRPYRLPFGGGFRGRGHKIVQSRLWRLPWPAGWPHVWIRARPR